MSRDDQLDQAVLDAVHSGHGSTTSIFAAVRTRLSVEVVRDLLRNGSRDAASQIVVSLDRLRRQGLVVLDAVGDGYAWVPAMEVGTC